MSRPAEIAQPAAAITLGRRIVVAAIVFMAAHAVTFALQFIHALVIAYRLVPSFGAATGMFLNLTIVGAVLLAVFFVLIRAQGRIAQGRPGRLATMPESALIAAAMVMLLLTRLAPRVEWDASLYTDSAALNGLFFRLMMTGLSFAMAVAVSYVWVWWCNSPPRAERLILVAVLSWVGFELLMDVADVFLPTLFVLVTRTTDEANRFALPGSDAFVAIHLRSWMWRVGAENVFPSLRSWLMHVSAPVPVAAAVGAVLYRIQSRSNVLPPAGES